MLKYGHIYDFFFVRRAGVLSFRNDCDVRAARKACGRQAGKIAEQADVERTEEHNSRSGHNRSYAVIVGCHGNGCRTGQLGSYDA